MSPLTLIGRALAKYLAKPSKRAVQAPPSKPELLAETLQKGDVLLVEGASRFGTAVKYLTQSTWSHAALCVSKEEDPSAEGAIECEMVEADVVEGVRRVSLSTLWKNNTRICRPVGLSPAEIDKVVGYAVSRIGHQYDLEHVIDLARYLIQTPPVPSRWRRRLLSLGSGDPTRAICSSLIAQAFQSIPYPILPVSVLKKSNDPESVDSYDEFLHIRHYSLFAPRDFDISPYFQIVKPTLEHGFDPHNLNWIDTDELAKDSEIQVDHSLD